MAPSRCRDRISVMRDGSVMWGRRMMAAKTGAFASTMMNGTRRGPVSTGSPVRNTVGPVRNTVGPVSATVSAPVSTPVSTARRKGSVAAVPVSHRVLMVRMLTRKEADTRQERQADKATHQKQGVNQHGKWSRYGQNRLSRTALTMRRV